MSETTAESTTTEQHNDGGNSGYTPPATQQELNRIIADRVKREREKFGDYEDLKGKAARLAEIEAANMSEAEKAASKIAAAEAEVATVPAKVAETLRSHLIALHEINSDDAELFLTASDPDLLLKQVQRLVGRDGDARKTGNYVSREGATSTSVEGSDREVVRGIFGGS